MEHGKEKDGGMGEKKGVESREWEDEKRREQYVGEKHVREASSVDRVRTGLQTLRGALQGLTPGLGTCAASPDG